MIKKISIAIAIIGLILIGIGIYLNFTTVKETTNNSDTELNDNSPVGNSSNEVKDEEVTDDFTLDMKASLNGSIQYGSLIEVKGEYLTLSIDAKKFNLPSNLYDYKDYILIRITYTTTDYEVKNCKIINKETKEVIENPTDEVMTSLFGA